MSGRFVFCYIAKYTYVIYDKKTCAKYYAMEGEEGIYLEIFNLSLHGQLPGKLIFDPKDEQGFAKYFEQNLEFVAK